MNIYLKRAVLIFLVMLFSVAYLVKNIYKRDFQGVFSQREIRTVVIDAGHGAPDGGAVADDGTSENEINLKIAKKLSAILTERCYNVVMTRETDEGIYEEGETIAQKKSSDMKKRERIMNNSGADAFVSIHLNKFGDESVHGAQVFYSTNADGSERLAYNIQSELLKIDDTNNRVHKAAENTIYLMKNAKIPAVIVECGFLSNKKECEKLKDTGYENALAYAIARGIEAYFDEF